MNAKISDAISRIQRACGLLLGDDLKKYDKWTRLEPAGTVKEAWQDVAKNLIDILDEIQSEDK